MGGCASESVLRPAAFPSVEVENERLPPLTWPTPPLTHTDKLYAQYRRVEHLCSELETLPTLPQGHPTTLFLLDEFIRVLSTYFREEELLMEEMQYVDLQRHHSEHAVVVGELLGLKARYRRGSTDFS